jgi:hypothetical protein
LPPSRETLVAIIVHLIALSSRERLSSLESLRFR